MNSLSEESVQWDDFELVTVWLRDGVSNKDPVKFTNEFFACAFTEETVSTVSIDFFNTLSTKYSRSFEECPTRVNDIIHDEDTVLSWLSDDLVTDDFTIDALFITNNNVLNAKGTGE